MSPKDLIYTDVGGHTFYGDGFTKIEINNSDSDGCYHCCWDPPGAWRAARWFDPPSGSKVPAEFSLAFEVHHHCCFIGPENFMGEVRYEGETLHALEGWTEEEYDFPIAIEGVEPGESFEVEVHVDYWPYDGSREVEVLTYILKDETPVRETTFSEVKSCY